MMTRGCRGNFTHEIRDNGTKCLVTGLGRTLTTIYYANLIVVMTITLTLFLKSLRLAYKNWIQARVKSQNQNLQSCSSDLGGQTAIADCSFQVLKTMIRLSITAFLYTFSLSPLVAVKMYEMYYGFSRHNTFHVFMIFYPPVCGVTIGRSPEKNQIHKNLVLKVLSQKFLLVHLEN